VGGGGRGGGGSPIKWAIAASYCLWTVGGGQFRQKAVSKIFHIWGTGEFPADEADWLGVIPQGMTEETRWAVLASEDSHPYGKRMESGKKRNLEAIYRNQIMGQEGEGGCASSRTGTVTKRKGERTLKKTGLSQRTLKGAPECESKKEPKG